MCTFCVIKIPTILSHGMSYLRKYEKRLEGAKFRIINELMYKNKEIKPGQLLEYHIGYRSQIEKWPVNPLTVIIEYLKDKIYKIADIGCGEAVLAQSINNVDSYDHYPIDEKIIKSDLNEIKCDDNVYDCVVYCLSLMKNDVGPTMVECSRILKTGGIVLIGEVLSRIDNLSGFYKKMLLLGFKKKSVLISNQYFIVIEFEKVQEPQKNVSIILKDCVYKKR